MVFNEDFFGESFLQDVISKNWFSRPIFCVFSFKIPITPRRLSLFPARHISWTLYLKSFSTYRKKGFVF